MWRIVCLASLISGCALKNDARYCDASRVCSDPAFPNCDEVKHECEAGGLPDGGSDDGGSDDGGGSGDGGGSSVVQ